MVNIFACTCPNRSGVGAIDNPDRLEQVFDTYYIPQASEENFMDPILMVCPQKMHIFSVLTEHSFTDCSALYIIFLELLKNRKQHNEILFTPFKNF